MLTTPSLGDSISVALRKLLQGGRRGSQAIQVYTKGSRRSVKQRSDMQLRNSAFSGKAQPLGSLSSFLSQSPQPSAASPASLLTLLLHPRPPLLSHHRGGDGILWVAVWGPLIHIWTLEITDVCDVSRLRIWQEIFTFHRWNQCTACINEVVKTRCY